MECCINSNNSVPHNLGMDPENCVRANHFSVASGLV